MDSADRAQAERPRLSRRWINLLLGSGVIASIASFFYPALRYMLPPAVAEPASRSVVAAKADELKNNSAKIFRFGARPALLVRTAEGEYRAFTAVCTHLNCTVQFREDLRQILCACHNGLFDLNGRNISGPPPRPLETFQVNIQGKDVVVTRTA